MTHPNNQPPGRLITHFANRDRQSQKVCWSELWDSDQADLWDRGMPSPALVDFITTRRDIIDCLGGGRRRPRALVPGCGRGYDVVMLALHGFDAVGLEVSQTAVNAARAYAEAELSDPSAYNFADENDEKGRATCQPGTVSFVCGDFFQRDWETGCFAPGDDGGFDLIYDYTFLCALLPEMRKDWAQRMQELVRPTGVLVCLEFPLYKDLKADGPPWGLQGVHWNLLAEGGDGRIDGSAAATDGGRGPFTRVAYIKPPRSYEMGRGTDMLSVWAPQEWAQNA
ncbi:S-adenosyl-L-methionine-dependent methyltransferase [Chaetomium tenue]|uniref:S-adenosyl-L-methionine-dependent methyltransferase n=1 Tax=Chaetomium tenue TaxID=1854479 RepID=A0ACB7PC74_9PEZI|nr:S-adenosyl-L-methionine-dependent methyltransferase [Chaetomium globosum]